MKCSSKLMTLLVLQLLLVSIAQGQAQQKVLIGVIKDIHSDENVPFASVTLLQSKKGTLADSAGGFKIQFSEWPKDVLEISYVGYEPFYYPLSDTIRQDTLHLLIHMERASYGEVIVRAKFNPGLSVWRRIVRNKPQNDKYRFDNFSYELYNKLELDVNNVNKDKLKKGLFTKPIGFIFDNIDTTEDKPFLPVYLTESISDYYYQKAPKRYREVFKASKTVGLDNQSVAEKLGGMDQNINVYNNFIPVFNKEFVSPASNSGSSYYNYSVADTQVIAGKRYYHLIFSPKRKGENVFEGDCWVHDSSFAIQKMTLRLGKEADLNFVSKLSMIQEFAMINDSTWFLLKDKFVADINPIGKNSLGLIGRKTTTYRNIKVNDTSVIDELANNKLAEETVFPPEVRLKTDAYWAEKRHEQLSGNEAGIYAMIDTLTKLPIFHTYKTILTFLGTGYHNIGNYEIGPWYNWISANNLEGLRLRFDFGTNHHFNKRLWLTSYLAYGFKDDRFKGKVSALYLLNKQPRSYIRATYFRDLDNGQTYYDEISADNIFALAVRKPNVPYKFLHLKQQKAEYYKSWASGFSILFAGDRKIYNPMLNLPEKQYYATQKGNAFNNFETSVRFRFAYLEKFLEGNFLRLSLGSPLPIAEVKYARGFAGVLNSSYSYDKLSASVSDYMKIAPLGELYYNVFAGKTMGTLPYMLLDVHPGNEIYYYNKYAFNLMNRFEYIADQFVGINLEHQFGTGIFKYIPLVKKLKFRQFWNAKAVVSTLSDKNKALNFQTNAPFQSLDGKTYVELGTGVDNILRVFRADFVWRVLPQPLPVDKVQKFGVFGSFRLSF